MCVLAMYPRTPLPSVVMTTKTEATMAGLVVVMGLFVFVSEPPPVAHQPTCATPTVTHHHATALENGCAWTGSATLCIRSVGCFTTPTVHTVGPFAYRSLTQTMRASTTPLYIVLNHTSQCNSTVGVNLTAVKAVQCIVDQFAISDPRVP